MTFADNIETRHKLRAPFPRSQIGKLPRTPKRPELDYVGHAAVTDRLNEVVPDWTYTVDDERGSPGEEFWIRGTITIGGVSRVEYGDGSDPKEAIGNFIRRAAMRFGVAIDLWSKEELSGAGTAHPTPGGGGTPSVPPPPTSSAGGASGEPVEVGGTGAGEVAGEGTDPAPATPEQRTRLLQVYGGKPSNVKAKAVELFDRFEKIGDVLITDLTSEEAKALILAVAS